MRGGGGAPFPVGKKKDWADGEEKLHGTSYREFI